MDLPKELQTDLASKRVLLFIGSGASLGSSGVRGLPSAGQLSDLIHTELLKGKPDPTLTLQQIAQRAIWACGGSRTPLEGVLTRVYADPGVKPQSHHDALAALRLPIVTTNFDQLIEQAYRAHGVAVSPIIGDGDVPAAPEPYVIKIHGCISRPTTCIVSEEDYYRWLSTESELKNLVRALFTTLRVVFIGYSIADVNFRILLSEIRRKLGSALKRPYIVAPKPDPASYNYEFLSNALGAHFVDATAEQFLKVLANTYGRKLTPYTEKFRKAYFSAAGASTTKAFIPFSAEQILEEVEASAAGPLLLDQAVTEAIFEIAKPRESAIYAAARSTPAPPGMVYVPDGEFIMGGSRLGNEQLRIEKIVKGFFIQDATVTNKDYRAFAAHMRASGDHSKCHPDEPHNKDHWPDTNFSGSATQDVIVTALPNDYFDDPAFDEYPAVNVDWWDAYAFAAWKGWRLPREVEWEKAARGIDGRLFPYGNTFDPSVSNVAESGARQPLPVRSNMHGRSPYGCFEMSGNVWEWCADLFQPEESEASPTRVLRGGSCTRGRVKAGVAFRNGRHVSDRWVARGFRCVIDV